MLETVTLINNVETVGILTQAQMNSKAIGTIAHQVTLKFCSKMAIVVRTLCKLALVLPPPMKQKIMNVQINDVIN